MRYIDAYNHFFPPRYFEALCQTGFPGIGKRVREIPCIHDLDVRFRVMDQFDDYVQEGPLTEFFRKPDTVFTPRVLKDGADSVGALGALNRVYINIGLYSEEWLRHFNALVGGKPTTKIEIATAQTNSGYWQATEAMTPDMALFFL